MEDDEENQTAAEEVADIFEKHKKTVKQYEKPSISSETKELVAAILTLATAIKEHGNQGVF